MGLYSSWLLVNNGFIIQTLKIFESTKEQAEYNYTVVFPIMFTSYVMTANCASRHYICSTNSGSNSVALRFRLNASTAGFQPFFTSVLAIGY